MWCKNSGCKIEEHREIISQNELIYQFGAAGVVGSFIYEIHNLGPIQVERKESDEMRFSTSRPIALKFDDQMLEIFLSQRGLMLKTPEDSHEWIRLNPEIRHQAYNELHSILGCRIKSFEVHSIEMGERVVEIAMVLSDKSIILISEAGESMRVSRHKARWNREQREPLTLKIVKKEDRFMHQTWIAYAENEEVGPSFMIRKSSEGDSVEYRSSPEAIPRMIYHHQLDDCGFSVEASEVILAQLEKEGLHGYVIENPPWTMWEMEIRENERRLHDLRESIGKYLVNSFHQRRMLPWEHCAKEFVKLASKPSPDRIPKEFDPENVMICHYQGSTYYFGIGIPQPKVTDEMIRDGDWYAYTWAM